MFKAPKNTSNISTTSKRKSFAPSTNTTSVREGIVSDSSIDNRRTSVPHPSERFTATSLYQNKAPNELAQLKSTHHRFSLPPPKTASRPSPLPNANSPPLSSSASDKSTSSSSSILSSKRSSINIPPLKPATSYLQVGDKVQVEVIGLSGTLRFLGSTKFKPGIWAGVELDTEGAGKNDGIVDGVQYFSCAPKSGLFILAHKVSKIPYSNSFSQCTPISESASETSEDCYIFSKEIKRTSISATSSGFRDQHMHIFRMAPYQTAFSLPSSSPNIPLKTPLTLSRSSTPVKEVRAEELNSDLLTHESTPNTDNDPNDTRQLHLKLEILKTENEFLKLEAKQNKSNSELGILKTEVESLRRQKQEWEREKLARAQHYRLVKAEMDTLNGQFNELILNNCALDSDSGSQKDSYSKDTEEMAFLSSIRGIKEVLSIKDAIEKELRDHILRLEASNGGNLTHDELIVSLRAELKGKSVEIGKLTAQLNTLKSDFNKEKAQFIDNLAKSEKENTLTNRDMYLTHSPSSGKQDVDSLTRKIQQYETTIRSQEKLLRDFKAAGAEAFDHYERTLQSMKNENLSLKEQAENVVNACRQLESDANSLRFELDRAKVREEELSKESISLQETVDNYQLSNTKRKEEIQKLKQELQKQSSQILSLTQNSKSEKAISNFNDEKNVLLSQIDELLSSVNSLEAEKLDIIKSHQELLEHHANAKSEMAHLRTLFEQFDTERSNWTQQQTILQQQLDEFSKIIEVKDRELQNNKEELARLNEFLKERDSEINSLKAKIDELESCGCSDVNVDEMSSNPKDRSAEISQLKNSLERLQKDYSCVLEENEKLQDEHVQLMEAQENLLEAHTHMETECLKLMEEVEKLHSEPLESAELSTPIKPNLDATTAHTSRETVDLKFSSYEDEDSLSSTRLRHTIEIREMQKKITDLELSKQHELDLQAKNMAELEALIEDKIFKETELEEQISEFKQKIEQLEKRLESARGDGSLAQSKNNLDIGDDILTETNLNSLRNRILYSPVDEELFCELCDQSGHDILSCPEYSIHGQSLNDKSSDNAMYCENCEEFGYHWTDDCPNQDETF